MNKHTEIYQNGGQAVSKPKRIWCEKLDEPTVRSLRDDLIEAYFRIPVERRFTRRTYSDIFRLPGEELQHWNCWSELNLYEPFLENSPSGMTFAVHRIMLQGGVETWLRWLGLFSDEGEIALLLWNCGNQEDILIPALDRACKTKDFSRLKPLLLFSLVADPLTDDAVIAGCIRENGHALVEQCAEILADYTFLLRNPKRVETRKAAAEVCAGENGVIFLLDGADKSQGKLAALAELLCGPDAPAEQLRQYMDAYFSWVRETELRSLQHDFKGCCTEQELAFLTNTADILYGSEDAVRKLEQLWPRKTAWFYGWRGNKAYAGNAWFQHIGLLLWRIGHHEYADTGKDDLLFRVLDTMNRYLPDALNETAYDLLLLNLLCDTDVNTPRLKQQQIYLIHKAFSLPIILGAVPHQAEAEHPDPEVLAALRDRLLLLRQLPQKRADDHLYGATQEQLQRLEERLRSLEEER